MHRSLLPVLVVLVAGCGATQAETQPNPVPVDLPQEPRPAAAPQDQAAAPELPPPPKITPLDLRIAKDSAADQAALDALQRTLPDSLPELRLDTPTWDLNVADFADEPRVEYWVDFFTGRGRERFQVWLDRMPRFEAYARLRLSERGLPSDMVYVALIESGFSPVAVSSAKAVGMWQFMPATGRGSGLRIDAWVDERRDPIRATDAAARHLRELTDRFGSHYLAAAAYNAGAGKVGRGLTAMGTTMGEGDEPLDLSSDEAFFSLADTRLIRQETKDYVPKLIAAAMIAKEPTKYGFRIDYETEPFPLDSVILDGGTGLDLVARLADTTLDALRELNPHLIRAVTPPGSRYPVRVPVGRAERIGARYAALDAAERVAMATHRVKKGETVTSLAKKYGVGAEVIRTANRSARGKRLTVGSTLYIPLTSAIPVASLREPEPVSTARTTTRTHIVRGGETLTGIAKRYGVSVASLRGANRLSAKAGIRAGQKLVIRRTTTVSASTRAAAPAAKRATASTAAPAARTHTVRAGETIGAIASRYGVGQSKLLSANGLGKSGKIRVGQKLKIPG